MVYIREHNSSFEPSNDDMMKEVVELCGSIRGISMGLESALGKLPDGVENVWMEAVSVLFQMSYALKHEIPVQKIKSIPEQILTAEFESVLEQLSKEDK